MKFNNIPEVKLGIVAVSRDCFPIALSTSRREAVVQAYGEGLYNCPVTVENETDALKALEDVRAARPPPPGYRTAGWWTPFPRTFPPSSSRSRPT